MLIKMKESKGFTLVELMIVVAIIGILAAVAVPFYQKYIQKSRVTSKVMPGVHSIQTNLATYYSFKNAFPAAIGSYVTDADTTYFGTPGYDPATMTITFTLRANGTENPFKGLIDQGENVLTAQAMTSVGKITGWQLGGSLATALGLAGEK